VVKNGYILKVELIKFIVGIDKGHDRKERS
jgi:hypothetical protein